jgi:hypothetical protein
MFSNIAESGKVLINKTAYIHRVSRPVPRAVSGKTKLIKIQSKF